MRVEVGADGREEAVRDILYTHRLEVERGSGNGHEDEHDVVDEERGEQNERSSLKLVVACEEVEEHHQTNHRIVGSVTHAHQLADGCPREGGGERERRLEAKHRLLCAAEHVVEVGEHAVELIRVGVPPR